MENLELGIEGVEEVVRQLEDLPLAVVKYCYRDALDAACVPVLEALESTSMIPTRTGDLRAHVMFVIEIDKNGLGGVAFVGFGDAGWKARLIEYGHREIGHKPGLKDLGGTVTPNPFMSRAFSVSGDIAIDAFVARLLELINSEVIVIDQRTAA